MRRSVLFLPVVALFLALTGFDCGGTSSQVTTAKVAIQRNDYPAAVEALKKELAAHPENGTAWLMLAESYERLGQRVESMHALEKARTANAPKITGVQLEDTYVRQYNLWRDTYNEALSAARNKAFDRALAILDTAELLSDNPENLYFRATLYEDSNDAASALKTYEEYITRITPSVTLGEKLGLSLGMSQSSVVAKLGKPAKTDIDSLGGYMFFEPRNLYVYFAPAASSRGSVVEGWRVYEATFPEKLREAPALLRADPYAIVGTQAQAKADYDNALKYLQALSRLDPNREGVSAAITQIYIDTKRTDEAIATIRAEIAANAKDPRPYLDLGNLYFGSERFRDAADAFNKVLDLNLANDDQYLHTALFNLGAVYKNWGAKLQDSIRRVSGGKPTKAQNEAYFAPLRESAKYFARYHTMMPSDFSALVELANVYEVLGDVAQRDEAVRALEGLASVNMDKREYWRAMSRLYAILGDEKKATDADKRAESLPK
jgi:predicted Zn-dependent protease